MNNYKVKVNNEAESKEVQELFFALGAKWAQQNVANFLKFGTHLEVIIYKSGVLTHASKDYADRNCKDCLYISISELRNIVPQQNIVYAEYIVKTTDGWILQQLDERLEDTDTCKKVPSDAEIAIKFKNDPDEHGVIFYKNNGKSAWYKKKPKWDHDSNWDNSELLNENFMYGDIDLSHDVLWSRFDEMQGENGERLMESIGKLNGNPSLNDQYAEIEQVRKDAMKFNWINSVAENDNVNHPSHYASGAVECIDAIESSMSVEAFRGYCKGNVQKYIWRYEDKGGKESLEKAQWYLNRLLGTFE